MRSTRSNDTRASNEVTKYLYTNLYKHIYKEPIIVTDKIAQLSGIDIWDTDSNVTIDEKCRITMIERKRSKIFIPQYNTFAIELGWLRNGVRTKGWGLTEYNTPTYYNFIWLWKTDVDKVDKLRKEHIRYAECLMVEKSKLQRYMEDTIGNEEKVWERVNYMWDRKIDRVWVNAGNGMRMAIVRSWQLHECPVCVVIPKNVLDKLATHIYNVYINRYEVVK